MSKRRSDIWKKWDLDYQTLLSWTPPQIRNPANEEINSENSNHSSSLKFLGNLKSKEQFSLHSWNDSALKLMIGWQRNNFFTLAFTVKRKDDLDEWWSPPAQKTARKGTQGSMIYMGIWLGRNGVVSWRPTQRLAFPLGCRRLHRYGLPWSVLK